MWFCSSPFGIAYHLGKWSRVLTSGCGFLIVRLIGDFVRGIWSLWRCFAAFTLSSQYQNTTLEAFVRNIWNAARWRFNCQFTCLRSIITFSGSVELRFEMLPCWRIWSEKWFRRCIMTNFKSNSSTTCCVISDSVCILLWSMRQCIASANNCSKRGHSPAPPICPK